jgi:hypothetical protein
MECGSWRSSTSSEMYGFPLTIYLLSGWLGDTYPVTQPSLCGLRGTCNGPFVFNLKL